MKYSTTELNEFGKVKVGALRTEWDSKRRLVMCKGIHLGEDGNYYAHWQYVLRKTLKQSSKSISFLTKIETN